MTKSGKNYSGKERRKSSRRPIIESFSFFLVVPKKGFHRLPIHDVSDFGLGFDIDTEGEDLGQFPVAEGETIQVHFYLNQSLYIPLEVNIARVEQKKTVRSIGSEIAKQSGPEFTAFQAVVQMVDQLIDVSHFKE